MATPSSLPHPRTGPGDGDNGEHNNINHIITTTDTTHPHNTMDIAFPPVLSASSSSIGNLQLEMSLFTISEEHESQMSPFSLRPYNITQQKPLLTATSDTPHYFDNESEVGSTTRTWSQNARSLDQAESTDNTEPFDQLFYHTNNNGLRSLNLTDDNNTTTKFDYCAYHHIDDEKDAEMTSEDPSMGYGMHYLHKKSPSDNGLKCLSFDNIGYPISTPTMHSENSTPKSHLNTQSAFSALSTPSDKAQTHLKQTSSSSAPQSTSISPPPPPPPPPPVSASIHDSKLHAKPPAALATPLKDIKIQVYNDEDDAYLSPESYDIYTHIPNTSSGSLGGLFSSTTINQPDTVRRGSGASIRSTGSNTSLRHAIVKLQNGQKNHPSFSHQNTQFQSFIEQQRQKPQSETDITSPSAENSLIVPKVTSLPIPSQQSSSAKIYTTANNRQFQLHDPITLPRLPSNIRGSSLNEVLHMRDSQLFSAMNADVALTPVRTVHVNIPLTQSQTQHSALMGKSGGLVQSSSFSSTLPGNMNNAHHDSRTLPSYQPPTAPSLQKSIPFVKPRSLSVGTDSRQSPLPLQSSDRSFARVSENARFENLFINLSPIHSSGGSQHAFDIVPQSPCVSSSPPPPPPPQTLAGFKRTARTADKSHDYDQNQFLHLSDIFQSMSSSSSLSEDGQGDDISPATASALASDFAQKHIHRGSISPTDVPFYTPSNENLSVHSVGSITPSAALSFVFAHKDRVMYGIPTNQSVLTSTAKTPYPRHIHTRQNTGNIILSQSQHRKSLLSQISETYSISNDVAQTMISHQFPTPQSSPGTIMLPSTPHSIVNDFSLKRSAPWQQTKALTPSKIYLENLPNLGKVEKNAHPPFVDQNDQEVTINLPKPKPLPQFYLDSLIEDYNNGMVDTPHDIPVSADVMLPSFKVAINHVQVSTPSSQPQHSHIDDDIVSECYVHTAIDSFELKVNPLFLQTHLHIDLNTLYYKNSDNLLKMRGNIPIELIILPIVYKALISLCFEHSIATMFGEIRQITISSQRLSEPVHQRGRRNSNDSTQSQHLIDPTWRSVITHKDLLQYQEQLHQQFQEEPPPRVSDTSAFEIPTSALFAIHESNPQLIAKPLDTIGKFDQNTLKPDIIYLDSVPALASKGLRPNYRPCTPSGNDNDDAVDDSADVSIASYCPQSRKQQQQYDDIPNSLAAQPENVSLHSAETIPISNSSTGVQLPTLGPHVHRLPSHEVDTDPVFYMCNRENCETTVHGATILCSQHDLARCKKADPTVKKLNQLARNEAKKNLCSYYMQPNPCPLNDSLSLTSTLSSATINLDKKFLDILPQNHPLIPHKPEINEKTNLAEYTQQLLHPNILQTTKDDVSEYTDTTNNTQTTGFGTFKFSNHYHQHAQYVQPNGNVHNSNQSTMLSSPSQRTPPGLNNASSTRDWSQNGPSSFSINRQHDSSSSNFLKSRHNHSGGAIASSNSTPETTIIPLDDEGDTGLFGSRPDFVCTAGYSLNTNLDQEIPHSQAGLAILGLNQGESISPRFGPCGDHPRIRAYDLTRKSSADTDTPTDIPFPHLNALTPTRYHNHDAILQLPCPTIHHDEKDKDGAHHHHHPHHHTHHQHNYPQHDEHNEHENLLSRPATRPDSINGDLDQPSLPQLQRNQTCMFEYDTDFISPLISPRPTINRQKIAILEKMDLLYHPVIQFIQDNKTNADEPLENPNSNDTDKNQTEKPMETILEVNHDENPPVDYKSPIKQNSPVKMHKDVHPRRAPHFRSHRNSLTGTRSVSLPASPFSHHHGSISLTHDQAYDTHRATMANLMQQLMLSTHPTPVTVSPTHCESSSAVSREDLPHSKYVAQSDTPKFVSDSEQLKSTTLHEHPRLDLLHVPPTDSIDAQEFYQFKAEQQTTPPQGVVQSVPRDPPTVRDHDSPHTHDKPFPHPFYQSSHHKTPIKAGFSTFSPDVAPINENMGGKNPNHNIPTPKALHISPFIHHHRDTRTKPSSCIVMRPECSSTSSSPLNQSHKMDCPNINKNTPSNNISPGTSPNYIVQNSIVENKEAHNPPTSLSPYVPHGGGNSLIPSQISNFTQTKDSSHFVSQHLPDQKEHTQSSIIIIQPSVSTLQELLGLYNPHSSPHSEHDPNKTEKHHQNIACLSDHTSCPNQLIIKFDLSNTHPADQDHQQPLSPTSSASFLTRALNSLPYTIQQLIGVGQEPQMRSAEAIFMAKANPTKIDDSSPNGVCKEVDMSIAEVHGRTQHGDVEKLLEYHDTQSPKNGLSYYHDDTNDTASSCRDNDDIKVKHHNGQTLHSRQHSTHAISGVVSHDPSHEFVSLGPTLQQLISSGTSQNQSNGHQASFLHRLNVQDQVPMKHSSRRYAEQSALSRQDEQDHKFESLSQIPLVPFTPHDPLVRAKIYDTSHHDGKVQQNETRLRTHVKFQPIFPPLQLSKQISAPISSRSSALSSSSSSASSSSSWLSLTIGQTSRNNNSNYKLEDHDSNRDSFNTLSSLEYHHLRQKSEVDPNIVMDIPQPLPTSIMTVPSSSIDHVNDTSTESRESLNFSSMSIIQSSMPFANGKKKPLLKQLYPSSLSSSTTQPSESHVIGDIPPASTATTTNAVLSLNQPQIQSPDDTHKIIIQPPQLVQPSVTHPQELYIQPNNTQLPSHNELVIAQHPSRNTSDEYPRLTSADIQTQMQPYQQVAHPSNLIEKTRSSQHQQDNPLIRFQYSDPNQNITTQPQYPALQSQLSCRGEDPAKKRKFLGSRSQQPFIRPLLLPQEIPPTRPRHSSDELRCTQLDLGYSHEHPGSPQTSYHPSEPNTIQRFAPISVKDIPTRQCQVGGERVNHNNALITLQGQEETPLFPHDAMRKQEAVEKKNRYTVISVPPSLSQIELDQVKALPDDQTKFNKQHAGIFQQQQLQYQQYHRPILGLPIEHIPPPQQTPQQHFHLQTPQQRGPQFSFLLDQYTPQQSTFIGGPPLNQPSIPLSLTNHSNTSYDLSFAQFVDCYKQYMIYQSQRAAGANHSFGDPHQQQFMQQPFFQPRNPQYNPYQTPLQQQPSHGTLHPDPSSVLQAHERLSSAESLSSSTVPTYEHQNPMVKQNGFPAQPLPTNPPLPQLQMIPSSQVIDNSIDYTRHQQPEQHYPSQSHQMYPYPNSFVAQPSVMVSSNLAHTSATELIAPRRLSGVGNGVPPPTVFVNKQSSLTTQPSIPQIDPIQTGPTPQLLSQQSIPQRYTSHHARKPSRFQIVDDDDSE